MILDAAIVTRMTPEQWAQHPVILDLARARSIRVPAVDEIAIDAAPVVAFINRGKWVALCPEPICFGQAEDVWRDWPYFLCMRCGNASAGTRWRPVAMPADRQAIEDEVGRRPNERANWHPTEPGLGGSTVYHADDDPTPFLTIEQQNRALLAAQGRED